MKTINKYTYILLLSILAVFTSCEQDDEVAVAPASSNIQIIVEAFVNSQIGIIGQAGTNNATINLGFRLTEYSTTYNGSDIIIHFQGNEYVIEAGESEVIVGNSNIEFEIDAPSGGVPHNGTTVSTQIDINEDFEIEVVDRPGDLVVLQKGTLSVTATIYSEIPEVSDNSIELIFLNQNEDAGIWFGLSQFTPSGGWITDYHQNSNGDYPRKMSIPLDGNGQFGAIPNSADVAPNVIGLDLFPFSTVNMGYTILIMHPNGVLEAFSGNIDSYWFEDNAVVLVDVTDDVDNPGMKNYMFSEFE